MESSGSPIQASSRAPGPATSVWIIRRREEKVTEHVAFSGRLTGQGEGSVYHLSVTCRSQCSLQDSISLRAHLK